MNKNILKAIMNEARLRKIHLYELQSVTKIVRLASPALLFNVGCKLAAHFGLHCLAWLLQAWHNIESGGRGILGNFKQV